MREIAFAWDIPKRDHSKRALLHRKLFGCKVRLKEKTYYYDGILTKWVDGKRLTDCHHTVLGDSIFSIPEMERKFVPAILDAFKELKIPVRKLILVENQLLTW